jgi:antitoxin ParD1/3/4
MAVNVSLTSELENYVKDKVATGMYNSASEVMREALRLMEERDAMQAARLEALQREISKGLDSLEREGSKPLDIASIKAKGRAKLAGASF